MGEHKAGHIKPAAEGQVLMIQARDQVWGKFGLAEVKALERGGRGKKSAHFCNLASIHETEDDSGVARETALLQRSQVFRFAKLLNLSRISNFKGTLEKNWSQDWCGILFHWNWKQFQELNNSKNGYWSRTGGSIARTNNNNFSVKLGIFPEN